MIQYANQLSQEFGFTNPLTVYTGRNLLDRSLKLADHVSARASRPQLAESITCGSPPGPCIFNPAIA